MKSGVRLAALAAVLGAGLLGAGATMAQDATTAINQRQDAMKAIGKSFAAVRAFTEDKGDLAAARAGGADLVKAGPTIPGLFPQKTSTADFPGKSYAKPEIWAQWDKFNDAAKVFGEKAAALNTALAGGDKAAIKAAFDAMGKDGCGGCHTPFRERKT